MDGVLLLYKEKGPTSHDAISALKKKFSLNKIGHTGTLDPMADGLLMVMINNGTKLAPYLHFSKEYVIEILFGKATDTDDMEGTVINELPAPEDLESGMKSIISSFMGTINQRPPAYSAIKKDGKKMYELARKGEKIDIPEREVNIYDIEILEVFKDTVKLRVSCSTGTYMRSLARDMGDKLGSCATLSAITRSKIGKFRVEDSVKIDDINNLEKHLLSPNEVLYNMPKIEITDDDLNRVKNGNPIKHDSHQADGLVKLVYNNELKAIGEIDGEVVKVKRGIST